MMPVGVWDVAGIALKTLSYAATLGAAGAVFFLSYCSVHIARMDSLRIRRMVLGLAVLSVVAGLAQIMVSAASMSGQAAGLWDGSLLGMAWQAGAGRANVVRVTGLLLAMPAVFSERRWLALPGAMLAATSFAWTGHARSLDPDVIAVLLLCVHLLGAAFWLGALTPLLIVARDADLPRLAAVAGRFGAVAVFVVGALLAAGLTLLCMLLGGIAALWSSAYGRGILVKLTLVACLLGLAAFNKLRLTPRLRRGDARASRSLRTSICWELLLGLSILAVTAAFTSLTGPPALD
jgi:putative copper resistance protein D